MAGATGTFPLSGSELIAGLGLKVGTVSGITFTLAKIDIGQRVFVTYTLPRIGAEAEDFLLADTIAVTETDNADIVTDMDGTDEDLSPVRITTLEGGKASVLPGSGMVTLNPSAAEAGAPRIDITVTYTAHSNLRNYDIQIFPRGIVIDTTADSTQKLQKENSNVYGYVTGSMSDNLTTVGSSIKWTNIDLDKDKTLTAKIQRVDIITEVGEQRWPVWVTSTTGTAVVDLMDNPDIDGDERPLFSVVKTSGDAVKFEIVGDDTFPAGSESFIVFKFTAEETAIRGGSVSLTIPSALGSAPTITKKVNGRVKVEISGGNLEKDQALKPTVSSGGTITAGIKNLDVGGTVTVTYGHTGDDGKIAVLSDVSNKDPGVPVTGTFRTSSTASTRTAGTVHVIIGNIAGR